MPRILTLHEGIRFKAERLNPDCYVTEYLFDDKNMEPGYICRYCMTKTNRLYESQVYTYDECDKIKIAETQFYCESCHLKKCLHCHSQ